MEKRKERAYRVVAVIACLALVVGLMPAAAFAKAGDDIGGKSDGGGTGSAVASTQAAIAGGIQAADGQLSAQGAVSAQELNDTVKELIEKMIACAAVAVIDPEEAATMGAEWGAELFCKEVLGISVGSGEEAALRDILAGIKQLQDALTELQKTVENAELNQILNSLIPLLSKQTTSDVYNALQKIDSSEGTAEYKMQQRISALTDDLKITEDSWGAVDNTYDDFVWDLWTALTTRYDVTLYGKNQKLTLFQIQYEHLRNSYKWEHQAYSEWAAYQAQCVSLLMAALNLEKHSLQARIQLLKDKHPERDRGAVESRLEKIQDCLNQAAGFKGKDPDGKAVEYPGLFSKDTWAAQYWMYKERPDDRYYWVPGHEILFYAQVNTQNVPKEKKGVGAYDKNAQGYSYWTSGYGKYRHTHHKVKFNFWKPFVRYQGGDSLLVSVNQLKTIYKDYGSKKHLYDIFIGKNEGNFQGLKEGKNKYWWFVVDPDSDHPLTYEDNGIWAADQLYCYVVKSASSGVETAVLAYYHSKSNEPNTNTHYIGIGVKRTGPETYDQNGRGRGGESPKAHTMTKLVKSFGDRPFSVAMKAKKGVKYAYSSSNKKVATVSSAGKVTMKRAGTAKITIKTTKAGKAPSTYTMTLKVKKAKNPIKLAKKTVTASAAKLKKSSQKVAGALAKKAKGKVTYAMLAATKAKKVKKDAGKYFAVSKKSGKITVKKGTPRGTYQVKVKAQAAGNANYKKASKKAVVTVRVG